MNDHDMSAPDGAGDESGGAGIGRRVTIMALIVLVIGSLFIGIWMNVHYELPDANDPAVVAETKRAITAIERYVTTRDGAKSARCAARLLERVGGAALVHAACTTIPGPSSSATAYRVEADGTVSSPPPGDGFEAGVRRLFGRRLGDWYLNHTQSFGYVRPPTPTGPDAPPKIPGNSPST